MKYGMNLLLWTGDIDESHAPLFESMKQLGYDSVELPMFAPDVQKFTMLGKQLDAIGLERTAVTIRGEEDNPISPDPAVRARGVDLSKQTIDACAAGGATHLVGPYHSAIGVFSGAGPTDDEWKWGVESMQQVAVDACKDVLAQVHISENDRSTPGAGDITWDETFAALKAADYAGSLTVEAFGLALPEIAAATKIWRKMYDTEEKLAADALAFMKAKVAQHWG